MMNYGQRIEPVIRLVPQQPLTNSRLMVYCSTTDKIPINFHANWSRVNPQTGYREEIKNHEGSCYECSPMDYNYCIQVTVYYEEMPGARTSRITTFSPIKLNRDLQERQIYVSDPLPCKIGIQDMFLDSRVIVKCQCVHVTCNGARWDLPLGDFSIDIKYNCLAFTLIIENRFQQLLNFLNQATGRVPRYRSKACEFLFSSRIDRDIILLQIAEDNRRNSTSSIKSGLSLHTVHKENSILDTSANRSRTDKSVSVSKRKENGKIKISERVHKKNSPNHPKQGQCLNIFEEELRFAEKTSSSNSKAELISMDLRGSFAELQHISAYKDDDKLSSHSFKNIRNNKKLEEENDAVKEENRKLRQELDGMSSLAKQNVNLKKKYHQLCDEINRLEFQRKEILEDKLKFEASFHRQAHQKQILKKQLDQFRQQHMATNYMQKRDISLSPFAKQIPERPVTPDRARTRTDFRGGIVSRGPRD